MKGYRFFADHDSATHKRKRQHNGNVIAVLLPLSHIPGGLCVEAIAAMYSHPNSGVGSCSVSRAYLRSRARRVSEAEARSIHPAMFDWLDSFEE